MATDVDTRFLNPSWAPNLEVLEHDVVREGFPPGPFDLVHARALLIHLPDRESLLASAAGSRLAQRTSAPCGPAMKASKAPIRRRKEG